MGAYAIAQGTLSAGANYAVTFVSADFAITAKPITVTADAGQSKVFGSADPALTYVSSDLDASFSGVLTRAAGEDVGAYAIGQGTLSAGANYNITFVGADLAITAKRDHGDGCWADQDVWRRPSGPDVPFPVGTWTGELRRAPDPRGR